jgi:hypothetical protein
MNKTHIIIELKCLKPDKRVFIFSCVEKVNGWKGKSTAHHQKDTMKAHGAMDMLLAVSKEESRKQGLFVNEEEEEDDDDYEDEDEDEDRSSLFSGDMISKVNAKLQQKQINFLDATANVIIEQAKEQQLRGLILT